MRSCWSRAGAIADGRLQIADVAGMAGVLNLRWLRTEWPGAQALQSHLGRTVQRECQVVALDGVQVHSDEIAGGVHRAQGRQLEERAGAETEPVLESCGALPCDRADLPGSRPARGAGRPPGRRHPRVARYRRVHRRYCFPRGCPSGASDGSTPAAGSRAPADRWRKASSSAACTEGTACSTAAVTSESRTEERSNQVVRRASASGAGRAQPITRASIPVRTATAGLILREPEVRRIAPRAPATEKRPRPL